MAGAFALTAAALRFRGSRFGTLPGWLVAAIAAASGLAAVLAPGEPTGWGPLDAGLRAGLAGAVALAAAGASPWWTLVTAGAASVVLLGVDSSASFLPFLAVGIVAGLVVARTHVPALEALAAGLTVQALLRLDWPEPTGASAVAVLVCVTPVLVTGIRRIPADGLLVLRRWAAAVAAFIVVAGAGAAYTAVDARSSVEEGVATARSGLSLLDRGERQAAAAAFIKASNAFGDAERSLSSWIVRPGLAIPLVAQQVRALATLASAGGDLSRVAGRSLLEADLDGLAPRDGQVDLAAIGKLRQPLAEVVNSLAAAQTGLAAVESPWLLTPVADKHRQLSVRVTDARHDAETAAAAALVAPRLLGGEGPRRYFLAVQTPAEARGSGGFIGNWGEVMAVDGRLELTRFGRIADLVEGGTPPSLRTLRGHEEYVTRYGAHVPKIWGLLNFSTDFPTVADVIAQIYPQSGGDSIDGVIALDPYGFAAMLQLTGPITVPGLDDPLTAANAARFLLHEQYVRFEETEERVDFLEATAVALFDRFTTASLGPPPVIAGALSPAVHGRHLQLASVDDDEQRFFELIGASGRVPPLRADSVGFVGQNYGGNKIDWFLHRDATYDVSWNPATGEMKGVLEVRLRNDAPASGLPPGIIGSGGDAGLGQLPTANGENLMELSLYTVTPPVRVTLDGEVLTGRDQTEFGRNAHTAMVSVPAGSTRTLRVETEGRLAPGAPYRLDPLFQPMVNADRLNVRVTVTGGWRLESATGLGIHGPTVAVASWILDRQRVGILVAERARGGLL